MDAGKIVKGYTVYSVQCQACKANTQVTTERQLQAMAVFRQRGWFQRDGRWYCPKHRHKQPTQ